MHFQYNLCSYQKNRQIVSQLRQSITRWMKKYKQNCMRSIVWEIPITWTQIATCPPSQEETTNFFIQKEILTESNSAENRDQQNIKDSHKKDKTRLLTNSVVYVVWVFGYRFWENGGHIFSLHSAQLTFLSADELTTPMIFAFKMASGSSAV